MRRLLAVTFLVAGALPVLPVLAGEAALPPAAALHQQDWFHPSTGDLRADLQTAAESGRSLMLLWEQEGCVYCARLHAENFANPEVVALLKRGFLVVQMDMHGARAFTGLDGLPASEAALARKWRVTTTPTTMVLRPDAAVALSMREAEAFRLPGYLESFEYFSVLDYYASGAYATETLAVHMARLAADLEGRGIDPRAW